MNFHIRRLRNIVAVLLCTVVAMTIFDIIDLSIQVQQYYSGWTLIALLILLLSFYGKKKLSIIPLGSSSAWAQWHYYSGLLFLAIYLRHIEFSFPNGTIEVLMTIMLSIVLFSGIGGLLINRLFAHRLAHLDEDIIYERIPEHLNTLKNEVEKLILESVEQSGSTTLSDYYCKYLSAYFLKPRFFFTHLMSSSYAFSRIKNDLSKQMRYLNKEETKYAVELENFIRKKNLLDAHFALQFVLKYWGIWHFPVAILLLFMTLLHIVLVYAFRGVL